jgi:hypothetical protein
MLLAGAPHAGAQPAVTNLLEFQAGNIPFTEPANRTDIYDQFQIEYGFTRGRIGLRYEQDQNSEDQFDYRVITQRWAEWADPRLRVRVGNFYTLLGRGLVHRSFELPAVVLDQPGVRSRYGPSRDVDGVMVDGAWGPVAGRLLGGTPNSGLYSAAPENEQFGLERYVGTLMGGQLAATVWRDARLGGTYLRTSNGQGVQRELGSVFVGLDAFRLTGLPGASLPIYVEYAGADRPLGDGWFRTGARDTFALYAGAELLAGAFAFSAEWKDYREFRLGINDPPSLVREHAYTLLNRATHVLDATREQGFQLEGSWTAPAWGSVLANWSRADGHGDRFEERYVELHAVPEAMQAWEATVFYDEGKDEFSSIASRRIYGGVALWRMTDRWSVAVDLERQEAMRTLIGVPSVWFNDDYAALTVSLAGIGSLTGQWERSTDPEQEDPALALDGEVDPRHFFAAIAKATITEHHEATLLIGDRRGGRACTAGTCYEVQPFRGVELRLLSRF